MKNRDLRPCDACNKPLLRKELHTSIFYAIRVQPVIINPTVLRQLEGLSMMFGGNLKLAETFLSKELTIDVPDAHTDIVLCMDCAAFYDEGLISIVEFVSNRDSDESSE